MKDHSQSLQEQPHQCRKSQDLGEAATCTTLSSAAFGEFTIVEELTEHL